MLLTYIFISNFPETNTVVSFINDFRTSSGALEKKLNFCLFEMVRSAKIFISTARGSTSGGTRSFLRKNFAQTLHPDRKETWRSDFNKEFGIVHFEHQTIENTALPATWLRQVNPQPQNRRERAYSHRQNALFGILFTPRRCWNEIISPYSLITTSQRRLLEVISH